jgi:hypothetical protein
MNPLNHQRPTRTLVPAKHQPKQNHLFVRNNYTRIYNLEKVLDANINPTVLL